MRSLEGGNQLRERASHPNPCLDPSQSSPRTCVPPLGRPASPQYLQPLPDLSSTPSCVSPTLTHPATRMMTRSGSPATVIKKSAKAGPKATKVHPKNTAAPIAWQLGAERRPGPERRMGGARQLESPRGVATRPRKGRGAMSPPDPGEGEGGAPKIPNTGPRDFLYGSREGDKPRPQPGGHLPFNPHPESQWRIGGGGAAGGGGAMGRGGAARLAGSCSLVLQSPGPRPWEWLKPVKGNWPEMGRFGVRVPGFGWALAADSLRYFVEKGGSNPASS